MVEFFFEMFEKFVIEFVDSRFKVDIMDKIFYCNKWWIILFDDMVWNLLEGLFWFYLFIYVCCIVLKLIVMCVREMDF